MNARPHGFPLVPWIAATTAAEAIGMTAAATASVIAARDVADPSSASGVAASLGIVVAGGLVEGAALGIIPAVVLRRWVPQFRRTWWFVATLLVAGLGWAGASVPGALASGDGEAPPQALVLVAAAALGLVMGAALGAAQAPAFHDGARRPWRWVWMSAVAWTPTMVVMFAGATLPDASWSPAAIILTGALTGIIAGALLGVVTGVCAPRLEVRPHPTDPATEG